MDEPSTANDPLPPQLPKGERFAERLVLGAVCGMVVGALTTFVAGTGLPTPSGPNFAAGAMLGPAIGMLLVFAVAGCAIFAAFGAIIRQPAIVVAVAVFLGAVAIVSRTADEPLFRRILPYAFSGFAIAALAEIGVRSIIQKMK